MAAGKKVGERWRSIAEPERSSIAQLTSTSSVSSRMSPSRPAHQSQVSGMRLQSASLFAGEGSCRAVEVAAVLCRDQPALD